MRVEQAETKNTPLVGFETQPHLVNIHLSYIKGSPLFHQCNPPLGLPTGVYSCLFFITLFSSKLLMLNHFLCPSLNSLSQQDKGPICNNTFWKKGIKWGKWSYKKREKKWAWGERGKWWKKWLPLNHSPLWCVLSSSPTKAERENSRKWGDRGEGKRISSFW